MWIYERISEHINLVLFAIFQLFFRNSSWNSHNTLSVNTPYWRFSDVYNTPPRISSRWTLLSRFLLGFLSSKCPTTELFGISGQGFHGPDAFPVTQQTAISTEETYNIPIIISINLPIWPQHLTWNNTVVFCTPLGQTCWFKLIVLMEYWLAALLVQSNF